MSTAFAKASHALTLIPKHILKNPEIVTALNDGTVGASFLVIANDKKFVLRIDTPNSAELGLNRIGELEILQTLASLDISPSVAFTSADQSILLTHYLEGRVWTERDFDNSVQLARLARRLRQLHETSHSSSIHTLSLTDTIAKYAKLSAHPQTKCWLEEAHSLIARVQPVASSLCHNDLHSGNIIDNEGLRFLDWEYAGLGDPFFDLAVVVQQVPMNRLLRDHFLGVYNQFQDESAAERLSVFCDLFDRVQALWFGALGSIETLNPSLQKSFDKVTERLSN